MSFPDPPDSHAIPADDILLQAGQAVRGPRQSDYGTPAENWRRTVDIFKAMTGIELTPVEGVKFAMAMKLARLAKTPDHHDSIVDLAGYAWVYSQVLP